MSEQATKRTVPFINIIFITFRMIFGILSKVSICNKDNWIFVYLRISTSIY